MAKYQKKPIVVEAYQWFKNGDHPRVRRYEGVGTYLSCPSCGWPYKRHGDIYTLEGSVLVCPRDWIITGIKGEHYTCKPTIFDATYRLVEDD